MQTEVKTEYVDYTSDIVFPVPPEIKANHASELTDDDYTALVVYIVRAEAVFDTIAEREKMIKEAADETK